MLRLPRIATLTAILLNLPQTTAVSVKKETQEIDVALCIYRISNQYSALWRYLYYTLILSVVAFRRIEWLKRGSLTAVMLYSNIAALHAWVILGSSGKNPDVLDLDILPTAMICLAALLLPSMLWLSPALVKSRAAPIVSLWIFWIFLGTIACSLNIYILEKDPKKDKYGYGAFNFAELACFDDAEETTLLQSAPQLDSRHRNFTCTYDCFSSRPSEIRSAEEIFVIQAGDFFMNGRGHASITENVVVSTACGAVIFLMFVWVMNKKDMFPLPVVQRTLKQKLVWGMFTGSMFLGPIVPVSISILLGEIIMLRREGLLRTESHQSVGQWSPVVCAVFIATAALLDRYVFEPRRARKERAADIELAASQPPPPPYERGAEVHHQLRDEGQSRTSQDTDTSWRTATETARVVPTSRQEAISQMRELALRDLRADGGQRRVR